MSPDAPVTAIFMAAILPEGAPGRSPASPPAVIMLLVLPRCGVSAARRACSAWGWARRPAAAR